MTHWLEALLQPLFGQKEAYFDVSSKDYLLWYCRFHWGDPRVGGRIILRWIFRKWDVGVWIGLGWLGIETGGQQL
jgi:hypothetical protein